MKPSHRGLHIGLCSFFTAGRGRRSLRFCAFCARGESRRIWEMFNFLRRANKRVSHKTGCALTGSNRKADCTSRATDLKDEPHSCCIQFSTICTHDFLVMSPWTRQICFFHLPIRFCADKPFRCLIDQG